MYKEKQTFFLSFYCRYLKQYQSVLKQKLTSQEPSNKGVCNRQMSSDIVPSGINQQYLETSHFTLAPHHVIYSVVNFDIHNMKSNIQPKKWSVSDRLAMAKRKVKTRALSIKDSGSRSGNSHLTSEESPGVDNDPIHRLEDRISDNRLSDISSAGGSQESDVMSN